MKFTVLNWNIGGAKFLEMKCRTDRDKVRVDLNNALRNLIESHRPKPDVVTLQEIVRYRERGSDRLSDLIDPIDGYRYCPFPLIDSERLSSKAKWNKVKLDSDWATDTYFAQGNAFLFSKAAPCFPVWDLSDVNTPAPGDRDHFVEQINLESGLYFGDRNTEPRAALVAHFIYDPHPGKTHQRKPLDIFVVNIHLTTVMMEREGIPDIDAAAAHIRQNQMDVIFGGIVSRYNTWKQQEYPERGKSRHAAAGESIDRHAPVWILAGDFNFTPESEEYERIRRFNFIDVVPQKGDGTKAKGAGNAATLTLDYVFAGPKFIALDPLIEEKGIANNSVNHDVAVSDHYPMYATIPLEAL
jgi:endonuclease/exonuclease/phosphatase family metal-dependent hydrolase